MLILRSCFLPKFKILLSRLTLPHFSIYVVLPPHLSIYVVSPVHLQQLHLNIDDSGSSLPDMCLIQQCAYIAYFTQCLPSILEVLNTISPISCQDILSSYDNYQVTFSPTFLSSHISFRDYFAQLSLTTLLQNYSLKPKLQRFLYGICY